MSERVCYLNGEFLPESRASLDIRDLGFMYGDAVYDTARTFGGEPFLLEAHVDRLYDSLAYVRIDCGIAKPEMLALTRELVARNRAVLRPGEDYWVTQRISAGVRPNDGEPPTRVGPTVIIECQPIPLRARARYFVDGIHAVVAARRRIAPDALSPNAKTTNYLNMTIAQREVSAFDPSAWALLLDENGNLSEGVGCNLFVVKGETVLTPRRDFVLAGLTREETMKLCRAEGIDLREIDVSRHAAATADEAFFTSTSLCVCPVSRIDGRWLPTSRPGAPAGPVTRRLMEAWKRRVAYDYEAQYLRFLTDAAADTGL